MTMFQYILKSYRDMKDKPPKERWDYFVEYYKWPALAVVLVIVIIISSIITIANRKEDVFYGTLLNCSTNIEEVTYLDDFYPFADIDAQEEDILFTADISLTEDASGTFMTAFQTLIASVGAGRVDILVSPSSVFHFCSYNGSKMLADLRTIMDTETLEQLSDYLYYVDGDLLEEIRNGTATITELPDPHNPEAMSDPIPVAIDISSCTAFKKAYYPVDQVLYLGITSVAPHPETALRFVDYLFTE